MLPLLAARLDTGEGISCDGAEMPLKRSAAVSVRVRVR